MLKLTDAIKKSTGLFQRGKRDKHDKHDKFDIKAFLDNIGEVVYVADADTHELLYLNKAGQRGRGNASEIMGEKCYEVINGLSAPCFFCINAQLNPGEFCKRTYFNPKLGRYYLLQDAFFEEQNGRHLRFGMALDSKQGLAQALQEFPASERIINEALCFALTEADPDKAINMMLQYIGEQLKVDRFAIFEDNGSGTFENTFAWFHDGAPMALRVFENIPWRNNAKIWYEEFDKRSCVVVRNLEEFGQENHEGYMHLAQRGISTGIAAPIVLGDKRLGLYSLDNPPLQDINDISLMSEVLGRFVGAMLRHRDNMKELETYSNFDPLTGVLNRRALAQRTDNMDKSESLGLILCDLNGLKKANDELGHTAGDALITRTVEAMRMVMGPREIFRLGGDEFLCVRSGRTQEELQQDEIDLRAAFKTKDVSVAVGSLWRPDGTENFDKLVHEVDAIMYLDKRKHYGERRRGNRDPMMDAYYAAARAAQAAQAAPEPEKPEKPECAS